MLMATGLLLYRWPGNNSTSWMLNVVICWILDLGSWIFRFWRAGALAKKLVVQGGMVVRLS